MQLQYVFYSNTYSSEYAIMTLVAPRQGSSDINLAHLDLTATTNCCSATRYLMEGASNPEGIAPEEVQFVLDWNPPQLTTRREADPNLPPNTSHTTSIGYYREKRS